MKYRLHGPDGPITEIEEMPQTAVASWRQRTAARSGLRQAAVTIEMVQDELDLEAPTYSMRSSKAELLAGCEAAGIEASARSSKAELLGLIEGAHG